MQASWPWEAAVATNSSKGGVIRGEQVFTAWKLPNMNEGAAHVEAESEPEPKAKAKPKESPPLKAPTAEELESIRQAAYEEGLELGKGEGFELGRKEAAEQAGEALAREVEQLEEIRQALSEPLKQLDEEVESSLVHLAIAIARQLVRREVKTDPSQIVGVVREALGVLPINGRNLTLMLHPDDAELIREAYEVGNNELNWRIEEDPLLSRGGCRVLSDVSRVDATIESRLAAIIAPMLSGERARELDEETGHD
jgi:flagellar assembly protein FliH